MSSQQGTNTASVSLKNIRLVKGEQGPSLVFTTMRGQKARLPLDALDLSVEDHEVLLEWVDEQE